MDAPQQYHGGVGVHVYKAGDDGLAGAVDFLRSGHGEGFVADAGDEAVVSHQDMGGLLLEE